MAGPRNRMMPGEKAKDFKGTMGKLLTYLKKFLPSIVLVLVCAAASTVFSIFGPKVLGQATTKLFEGLIAMLTGTGVSMVSRPSCTASKVSSRVMTLVMDAMGICWSAFFSYSTVPLS